ncbi:MAG: DUF4296 domain-containing protein [Bacteroidales bacterium]|nr:DUF4296 domain-containing protein [Bacteroidales bacterium]
MRKSLFLLIMFVLVFSGCYQNNKLNNKKPKNLIPENKMALILKDMNMVTTIVDYRRARGRVKPTEEEYYQSVFQHYDVNAEQVRKSMDYYYSDEKLMVKIYDNILSYFTAMQSDLRIEKQVQEDDLINGDGLFNYNYKKQWIYRDSIPAFNFEPVF